MKYPYERFLIFLLSRKIRVSETLEKYGLPDPGDIWEMHARSHIRKSAPPAIVLYMDSKESSLSMKDGVLQWAEEEGFECLWQTQPEFGGQSASSELDMCLRIFITPYARAVIGLMLMSKTDYEDIIEVADRKLDLALTEETIDLYSGLFWDVEMMTPKTWVTFINRLRPQERNYIGGGLKSPGASEAKRMVGLDVTVDHDEMLKTMANKSYAKFLEAMESANPDVSNAYAKMWMEQTRKNIGALKERGGQGENDGLPTSGDFDKLFSVDVAKSSHPTLADLGGSVDLPETAVKVENPDG